MSNFLICDDSRFIRQTEKKLLERMGHNVIASCSNGVEAVNAYLDHWVETDIILLDVVMPKQNGLETLKQLLDINPFAKVIIVSSISNTSIVQGCMKIGAIDYVVKPFRLSEFVKAINKALEE